jgi:hypothetical protein
MDYLLITPDISIEHWEPQFLVFGSKNFGADFVTIERAHILQLKARIAVPFDIVTLRVDGSQYLPLSISYRPGRPGVVPAPPALPGPPPKTDGGRAFGLTVLIHM